LVPDKPRERVPYSIFVSEQAAATPDFKKGRFKAVVWFDFPVQRARPRTSAWEALTL
jgi:hypothetical protein